MTRSLWGNSHRRSGPEAVQGRAGPSRPAPARHRPVQQRRGPFSISDERRTAPPHYPGEQTNHLDGPIGIERNLRGNAHDVPAPAPTLHEAERHRQSEIARIRNEIMDIAREVADLRRRESGDLVRSAMTNQGGRSETRPPRDREPQEGSAQAAPIGAPKLRNRPQERPPLPNGRRHQLVERAHRNARTGNADPANGAAPVHESPALTIRDEILRFAPEKPKPITRKTISKRWSVAIKAALLTGVMLAGTGVITLALWGKLPWPALERQKLMLAEATSSVSTAMAARSSRPLLASAGDKAMATYPFEIPDTYGVYAITDGHLTPLEPLSVRVPDARVAISSPISKPAPAPVPSGSLQFAVYHRELATNVPESASVRVVAKVMQATTFVGGKPKHVPVEDTWAVRGGSIDLRIAPVAANKEMILIRPADPGFVLSPGRYVLMFRNQAYDFSVAGTVSDTAHCLERSDLQDRTLYSECRELVASAQP